MRWSGTILLAAILSLALTSTTQAQLAVGLRAGYNSSKLYIVEDNVDVTGISSRSGFHAGIDAAYTLSRMFAIEVGAAYSQKGAKDGELNVTLAPDYVDVPLLLAFNVPVNGNITPRVFAGGVASFEVRCRLEGDSESIECTDDNVGVRKKTYFSVMAGVGVDFAAGPGSLLLDVGYQYGLTDLAEDQTVISQMDVIQVSLGYRYPLGG